MKPYWYRVILTAKPAALSAGLAVALLLPGIGTADPTPARQTELRNLLKNDCGACHGLTLQGGMGPALLPERLAGKSDDLLVTTILEGRKGTAMPPWQPFMDRSEAEWLVGVLRKSK
ncbi:cytochrome c [Methylovulum psychrotolerans]|uniref:c-type cytochrome n=1 Tax=Methylovulum psychrotolerans TaxID=1704499 RepID=UPI001BFF70B2|nr:cytochrome c [Methylovulum psychrotolerans]MBT9096217.1 cytochrome c [Methylovulum psychrotolerans]